MLQIDASPHDWLEGRAPKMDLEKGLQIGLSVLHRNYPIQLMWLHFHKFFASSSTLPARGPCDTQVDLRIESLHLEYVVISHRVRIYT